MKLKDLDKEDQPREKLKSKGVKNLTNSELISIIISKGTKKIDVAQMSQNLLKKFNISKFQQLSVEELILNQGIGISKASQILAAVEFGTRVCNHQTNAGKEINSPKKAFVELRGEFIQDQESLVALFLNSRNKLILKKTIFIGTINKQIVSPREIVKHAIGINAVNIILAHNHPSGNLTPSNADIKTTNQIQRSLELFDLSLKDHLIVTPNDYFSMKENFLL